MGNKDFGERFKKAMEKIDVSTGFIEPTTWVPSPNYALNYLISKSFTHGFPNKRSFLLYGPSGSGKSYMLSLAAMEAQKKGYHVVWIDTENAAEQSYMKKCGLTLDEGFSVATVATIEDCYKSMSAVITMMKDDPDLKLFIAIDSISMMTSDKEMKNFDDGNQKGDQGQMAKKLKNLLKTLNAHVGKYDVFLGMTGHVYANQDLMNGKGAYILSGGQSQEFIPTVTILVRKLDYKDGGESQGIRIKAKIAKSRFSKYGTELEMFVPYEGGINPYDGLIPLSVDLGILKKGGAWYTYVDRNGNDVKFQKKDIEKHFPEIYYEWLENDVIPEENSDVED